MSSDQDALTLEQLPCDVRPFSASETSATCGVAQALDVKKGIRFVFAMSCQSRTVARRIVGC
jgi:hypothetical protein